ncbi:cytochrome c [Swingsia samuiensis]|uniref:C-type cytochrome n=1 Tax=Swingsia samuiensis TaxID=1293412 RepID=A0A4Y6UG24_9PROT|nr:cytochrome c [Swingsia samuiensis]QDH16522.1 c-type cytochrome [Swingsia samuiensis]
MKKALIMALGATLSIGVASHGIAQDLKDPALIKQGAYLARVADCMACHTALHGQGYAGGLKIATPIGSIYSTNITPDDQTGIGSYSLDEFAAAVRKGIRKDGSTLYPAMPYTSFSRITDADIRALYAYFQYGVPAVYKPNRSVNIVWPLSMRWPISIWRMLYAPSPRPFQPQPGEDPVTARGEYLVTGPGHCGACHTPRGVVMEERALDASDDSYLSGGAPIDNWVAPSLRSDRKEGLGEWSEEDIAQFLKTGRIDRAAVFGGMGDVVAWSTQHLHDDDLQAIAHYLKTLPKVQDQGAYIYKNETKNELDHTAASMNTGAGIYVAQCAICHKNDGQGVARMFPPLAGNPVLQTHNPASIVNVVVHGGVLPPTNWAPSAVAMPGYQNILTPNQVAMVVDYVRHGWGNTAHGDVQASDVRKFSKGAADSSASGWATASNGWSLLSPQPYGEGWTFSPETHTGVDNAQ